MDFTRRNVMSVTFDKDPKENILLKIVNDVLFYLQQ